MRALSRWATLLALITLLCGPSACSRRAVAAGAPAEPPPPGTTGSPAGVGAPASGDPATVTPGKEKSPPGDAEIGPSREILLRRQESAPTAPVASASPPSPLEREEQALLALPAAAVLPEDFRIGRLADLLQSDNPTRGIAPVAGSFLDALVRGDAGSALIEPGRREELSRSLAYYLSAGNRPETYRLGAVEIAEGDPDEAWLNLRLFGSPGRTEGELYLKRVSQSWYILDFQAELTGLRQPYSRAEDRFYPSVYAWGLD